jgi:uncharacterized protein involved in oxidation of intracellular sulfur
MLFVQGNVAAQIKLFSPCENLKAFDMSSSPDLGIVIYSSDSETVWNALRLANYAQEKGDTVVIFVVGKGMDVYMHDTSAFNIKELSIQFLTGGGSIYTCATCAKLRGTDDVQFCTITSMADLYAIVKRSKKIISF